MRLPSGLHAGDDSEALFVVRCRGGPPASGTVQRSALPRSASMSYTVTGKTAVFPSGETTGLPTRWNVQMSSAVRGFFSAAASGETTVRTAAIAPEMRAETRMVFPPRGAERFLVRCAAYAIAPTLESQAAHRRQTHGSRQRRVRRR